MGKDAPTRNGTVPQGSAKPWKLSLVPGGSPAATAAAAQLAAEKGAKSSARSQATTGTLGDLGGAPCAERRLETTAQCAAASGPESQPWFGRNGSGGPPAKALGAGTATRPKAGDTMLERMCEAPKAAAPRFGVRVWTSWRVRHTFEA